MEPSTPPPDRSMWAPPTGAPIASAPISARQGRSTSGGRHPAAQARRLVGWATLASAAAIIGYMVTADAQEPSTESVVTTIPATVPTTRPTQPAAAQPSVQLPRQRPNSSSHGS